MCDVPALCQQNSQIISLMTGMEWYGKKLMAIFCIYQGWSEFSWQSSQGYSKEKVELKDYIQFYYYSKHKPRWNKK